MSLRIIEAGLLDTVQDSGRYGYQHLGINPGGAMDRFSAGLGNSLLGKEAEAPVIEMHFPAPGILFEQQAIICLTGADFTAEVEDVPIPLYQPVAINKYSLLRFTKWVWGARCYLSVLPRFDMEPWLHSYSTNIKAGTGGLAGRALQKGDVIPLKGKINLLPFLVDEPLKILPWKVPAQQTKPATISFIKGAEWHWLTDEAKADLQNQTFTITSQSDRMGYRLQGKVLASNTSESLLSSPVTFGTVQLLPNGQCILLMADHQTTGGYPKVAQVISAHLPLLAQMQAGDSFTFWETDIETAERELWQQQHYLQQVKKGSSFKIEKLIHAALRP